MAETALTVYQKLDNPLAAAEKLGQWMARSGMFGITSNEQGQVLALTCISEGITPVAFKRRYHLIDGNLSMRSDAMIAEFRLAGGKHTIISRTPDLAAVALTLDGKTTEFRFTWAEAQAEPYIRGKDGKTLKKNWATPRARMQMMWARVVSDAVRAVAPEIVAGVYTPEEVSDFAPVSTPAQARPIFVASAPAASAPAVEEVPQDVIDSQTGEVIDTSPTAPESEPPAVDLRDALLSAGCNMDDVMLFLVEKAHWLTPGQSLADLSPANRDAILSRVDKFATAAREFSEGSGHE